MIKSKKLVSLGLSAIMTLNVFAALPFTASAAKLSDSVVGATLPEAPVSSPDEIGPDSSPDEIYGTYTTSDGLEYRLQRSDYSDSVVAVITGYWSWDEKTEMVIPSEINGYKVEEISSIAGEYDMSGDVSCFESVTIPETVININSRAFQGFSNLKSFNVDAQNKYYCDVDGVLFTLDEETGKLDDLVVYPRDKADATYQIPEGSGVDWCAFYRSNNLVNLNIPKSVYYGLDDAGLDTLLNLESINVDPENTSYASIDGVLLESNEYTGDLYELVVYPRAKADATYQIPESVGRLDYNVFKYCNNLVNLNVPKSVYYGLDDAGLDTLLNLESINVDPENKTYVSVDGLLFYLNRETGKPGELLVNPKARKSTAFEIPDYMTELSDRMIGIVKEFEYIEVSENNPNYSSVDGVLFNKDKTELIAYPAANSQTSYTIPDTVTAIADNAFSDAQNLEDIEFPESIVEIGNLAFSGTAWYENQEDGAIYINDILYKYKGYAPEYGTVSIREGTKSICGYAFSEQWGLSSIEMPDSVTYIGNHAFDSCDNLREIDLSESLTHIGDSAFCYCDNLREIDLPESLTHIGEYAFGSCKSLDNVKLPSKLTNVGDSVFAYCSSLSNIEFSEALTHIGEYAFDSCDSLDNVKLPSKLTNVGDSAFAYCTSLSNIEFSDSLTYIDDFAFEFCESLTDVKLPESVTYLGDCAFRNCENLKSINIPEQLSKADPYAFSDCCNLETVYYNAVSKIDSTNKDDWDGCSFSFEDSLKTVIYGDKVTETYKHFAYNEGIENVILGSNIEIISRDAFSGCSNLKSVTIPDNVTSIGSWAFRGCTSLESIVIPKRVTQIGEYAFNGCTNLSDIQFMSDNIEIGRDAFENTAWLNNQSAGLVYIGSTLYLYNGDKSELVNVEIKEGTTSIADEAFSGCTSLKSITIPDTVTKLGEGTFEYCTSLESVTIPEGVTELGFSMFYGCSSLESIYIPKNVSDIAYNAFQGCTSLKKLEVDSDNEYYYSVGNALCVAEDGRLLYYPTVLIDDNVQLPSGIKKISAFSFRNSSIKSVELPDTVTEIMYAAFNDNSDLAYVNIPDSVKIIGGEILGRVFYGCTSLKAVTIPSSVEFIGPEAFGYQEEFDYENYERKSVKTFDDFTIFGTAGTAAEAYANENGFVFVDLNNQNNVQTDKTSGIEVVADSDAELVISENTNQTDFITIGAMLPEDEKAIKLYDLSFQKDGEVVKHDGMAQVKIPCSNENAKVYRVESDNSLTDMNAVYADGYLLFYTEHFSEYVVAAADDVLVGDVNGDGEVNAKDRMMLTRYLAKWSGYEDIDLTAADVNNDGEVNAKDRMILIRHLAKWQGYETLPFDNN